MTDSSEIVLYQPDDAVKLEVRLEDETVWLSQAQMAELFGVKENNVTYHIQSIYKTHELEPGATTQKIRVVRQEGNRMVARQIDFYNLDMIISVGYRVNSIRGTQFRQWATSVLREFAIRGYVLDRKRMEMEDWSKQIDTILAAGRNEVLQGAGSVTAEEAKQHAETEFEKYRIVQDRLFQSDFDRYLDELPVIEE